jgi:hypothetical protein
MQKYKLPMSYARYWMRKFEFTQRHAVHEHEISKHIFIFPKKTSILRALDNADSLDTLGEDDFEEIEFRPDRLGYYTEQAAANRVMLKRCSSNALRELKTLQKSTDATERAKIPAVKLAWEYTRRETTVQA